MVTSQELGRVADVETHLIRIGQVAQTVQDGVVELCDYFCAKL